VVSGGSFREESFLRLPNNVVYTIPLHIDYWDYCCCFLLVFFCLRIAFSLLFYYYALVMAVP